MHHTPEVLSITDRLKSNADRVRERSTADREKIWLCFPYVNEKGGQVSRNFM